MENCARTAYRALNGLFCIYKPAGSSMAQVINSIKVNVARDLNKMSWRPARKHVVFDKNTDSSGLPAVHVCTDLADDPLVVGDRYIVDDIKVRCVHAIDCDSSGVVVMSVGNGKWLLRGIADSAYLRAYQLEAELGMSTRDCKTTGHIIEKTTYHHVTHGKMDKVISSVQAGHQKYMYTAAQVDPQSEEAYEMAVNGLLRPKTTKTAPVVYGIKCVKFQPPNFTIEIHVINETSGYLRWLVHELGLETRASAACSQVRRLRYGPVSLEHTLLRKHWTCEGLLYNIELCRPLLIPDARPRIETTKSALQRQLTDGAVTTGQLSETATT